MTLKRADILAALARKGFKVYDDGPHILVTFQDSRARDTGIFTSMSRGTQHKDIGDSLLGPMARQLKIRKSEFVDLVKCTLGESGYRSKLQESGVEI